MVDGIPCFSLNESDDPLPLNDQNGPTGWRRFEIPTTVQPTHDAINPLGSWNKTRSGDTTEITFPGLCINFKS